MWKLHSLVALTLHVYGGHPGSHTEQQSRNKSTQPEPSEALFRHEATFTTFCDTGSVAAGDCYCKGGSATAAIGDGSWLWKELVGAPCPKQDKDRCDCTSCGGTADDCPHEGCWQCRERIGG